MTGSPLSELIVGQKTLSHWGNFKLSVNAVTCSTTYTNSIPKANRDFLARHKTPIQRTFHMVKQDNLEYKKEMNKQCGKILKQVKNDYNIAFTDKIKPDEYIDWAPVRIHVREDATRYLATTARNYPVGWEAECRDIISQLESLGVISNSAIFQQIP